MQNKSQKNKQKLDKELSALLKAANLDNNATIKESLETVLKIGQIEKNESDTSLVATTLDEIHKSYEVFHSYRDVRKVCIFGSARTRSNHPNYKLTVEIAQALTKANYMTITGAGPGIMEAGNLGAGPDHGFGLNIELPFEQEPNPYIKGDPKLINYRYFYTRKLAFVRESDATVLMPGGFGTHDEGFEVLTLIQTGRCAPRPVILITRPGSDYWGKWLDYVKTQLLDRGYISEEDMTIFKEVHTAEEVLDEIRDYYTVYHSIRYFDDIAVMRLEREIKTTTLDEINAKFGHLLLDNGSFRMEELKNIPHEKGSYPTKKRLIFEFNKKNYGGLCKLIHVLTDLELNRKSN